MEGVRMTDIDEEIGQRMNEVMNVAPWTTLDLSGSLL